VGREWGAYEPKDGPPPADLALGDLAARQFGVVAAWQLVARGVTREEIKRRLRARRLHRLHRGVYAVAPKQALRREAHELAAVLACGPDALLSHRTAGARWGFFRSQSARIEVTAPRSRRGPRGIVVHRSRCLIPEDRAVVDGIPVTTVARTIVDLAEVLTDQRFGEVVNEAEVQRLFDLRQIRAVQRRLPGQTGRLDRVLAAYEEPPFTRNNAERRFLELCEHHSLPQPRANVLLHGYEVDFHWPGANLVVELDGAATHQTRKRFEEDRRRDRRLAKKGIQVLRVTWWQLDEGARDLAALLRR
jgi:very-short-patch-repair endonuclease